jgi:dienelactone hydrolase
MIGHRIPLLAMAVLLAAGTSAAAGAPEAVLDFGGGPPDGVYEFASWTPRTLPELLRGNTGGETTKIVGHLFLPAAGPKDKVPAIVLIHGSGGIYQAMLEYWPRRFNAAGYAVFAVDSFGPRGVKSTADDQSQVPFAADTADAFAALKLVASHPRIDPRRIAIMGFSRGGITVWRSAVERVIAAQKLPDGLRFAAHVPVYSGGCVGLFRLRVQPGLFGKAPMLWVHGTADDYAAMAPCRDYADKIGKAGTPVEFLAIDGALHKFDSDDLRRFHLKSAQKTLESCPVEIDIDTMAAYDRFTGQRLSGEAFVRVLRRSCSALGATVQGDSGARDKAAGAIIAFLGKAFAR